MAKRTPRKLKLETVLNSVDSPVFLIDSSRRVVFVNQGCELLTGWEQSELVGRVCDFETSSDPAAIEAVTGILSPPQEVLNGERRQVPAYFVHRETRQTETRLVHFFPFQSEGATEFVLGIVTAVPPAAKTTDMSVVTQVHAELGALRHQLRQRFGHDSIICRSSAMRRVLEQVALASEVASVVHFRGERGTGKQHAARVIHYASPLGQKAFVPIDCRSLPAEELGRSIHRLVETDWVEISSISALQPGCVYLEYIESLPRDAQQRIIEFFDSERGAAFREKSRLMTSSEESLENLRKAETISDRFFYLITTLCIEIPPLRSREGDLRPLAQSFVEKANRGADTQVTGLAEDTLERLEEYNWPGNVEELRQVIVESHAACEGSVIRPEHLPFRFRAGLDAQQLGPLPRQSLEPLEQLLQRTEREHIEAALELTRGNRAKAAKLLGISRPSLYRRLETLGITDGEAGQPRP